MLPATRTSLALLLSLSGISLGACLGSPGNGARLAADELPPGHAPVARGAALFAQHCAVCHGTEGLGDGAGAPYLQPPARDFSRGFFQWVSTTNGAPSDDDLLRTLRRGVPGSAMPAWSWLPEPDLRALVEHVRVLTREGLAARIANDSDEAGAPLTWEEARERAVAILRPDGPLPDVAEPAPTPELRRRGAEVYATSCAHCHGSDGTGERTPRWNPDGTPNWARDFTAGVLGAGGSFQALADRVRVGIPGTSMVPTVLPDEDLAALVAHVRSLIPAGAEDRLVHRRSRLTVRRVAALPEAPDDPAWEGSGAIDVVLAPLRWSEGGIRRVRLEGLHDGASIALRASWDDATADVDLFSDVHRPDGLAFQLSTEPSPPLFGMGSPDTPTTVWHWQSIRLTDVAGALDLVDPAPHPIGETARGEVRVDVPLYHRLAAVPRVSERVEGFEPRGVRGAARASRHPLAEIAVQVERTGTGWALVVRRPLVPADPDELALRPGDRLQVACAAWNGSNGDHAADKSISIWQELLLAP